MKKNFTTYALLGFLAVLVGWYTLYENKYRTEKTKKEEDSKLLFSLQRDDIKEIEIVRGADTVKLKKSDAKWLLVAPLEDRADEGAIGTMLTTLSTTKQDREVESAPKDLEPFGLKTPRLKILARKDESSPAQEVLVGADTPTGFSVYAKMAGAEPVYKVNKILFTTFDKTIFEMRNKDILGILRSDISEVEIHSAKEDVVLKADDKGGWLLARDGMPAEPSESGKFLSALTDLRAGSIASEKGTGLSAFGLQNPIVKITVRTKDAKAAPISLLVGKTKDNVFVKRDDRALVYTVDKANLEKLNQTAEKLRDKHLATFNRFDVKKVKLTTSSKEVIELVRQDSGWSFSDAKADEKVDTAKVDNLLTKLQDAKVSSFITKKAAEASLKSPSLLIQLFETKNDKELEMAELRFGHETAGQVIGDRKGAPMAFQLKAEQFKDLKVSRADLLEKKAEPKKEETKS